MATVLTSANMTPDGHLTGLKMKQFGNVVVCLLLVFFPKPSTERQYHRILAANSTFPMLFFDATDVAKYRRAATSTHQGITRQLKRARDDFLTRPLLFMPPDSHEDFSFIGNEIYGNNLPVMAFYCLLYPDDLEAIRFVEVSMDRMTSYPNWLVESAPADELPMAHSLLGFATAYDFLYSRFSPDRRAMYANKILTTTHELYHLTLIRWWGHSYIENHVATNFVALLVGGLVSSRHHERANVWAKKAVSQFERTMFLLNKVQDGSLNEGVAFGSYTTRSLTQYVHLVSRHYGISHYDGPWMKAHFWFYYATTLPGFQRSVGIADSNGGWWYGPESQLFFLDRFVLRNGSGNWLANTIRMNRAANPDILPEPSQIYSTLHTEFIWFDSTLRASPPLGHGKNSLHIFPDWGVVTYGFSKHALPGNTFLSFKSGRRHGVAVYDMANGLAKGPPWLEGWHNFNPGHEHPDQNSFTFAPNGQPFITEGLYAKKLSFLDNVLMFYPSDTSICTPSWGGQSGDCGKWLSWHDEDSKHAYGDILSVKHKDGVVYIEGEAAKAYPKQMGLRSWRRHLVLPEPDLLVVVDNVKVTKGSQVTHASSFFNNYQHKFELASQNGKVREFHVNLPSGKYSAKWATGQGQMPKVTISDVVTRLNRTVSNVNVTFQLEGDSTWIVYTFSTAKYNLSDMKLNVLNPCKLILELSVGTTSYNLKIEEESDFFGSQVSVAVSSLGGISGLHGSCSDVASLLALIIVLFFLAATFLCRRRRAYMIVVGCLVLGVVSPILILPCA